ncbi:hypothetical protein HPB51_000886 [Rhipicephalus microplus]|uniref:Uncharacterized protein n=1 Tax=Rhipicephalus microplus TaxID=6941 RepID=A0A9J6DKE9_RHIMP|nr:hypothetical protein HPB51_000886 [Rhipicephalus microplus]
MQDRSAEPTISSSSHFIRMAVHLKDICDEVDFKPDWSPISMKSYAVLWFFLGVMCSAMLTAHSQACRTERQQCSPRNACCEGLACAPMFLDDKNPQLFYGNCLQSVPSSLSRSEPPKPERPAFSPRGPVLRDSQR